MDVIYANVESLHKNKHRGDKASFIHVEGTNLELVEQQEGRSLDLWMTMWRRATCPPWTTH